MTSKQSAAANFSYKQGYLDIANLNHIHKTKIMNWFKIKIIVLIVLILLLLRVCYLDRNDTDSKSNVQQSSSVNSSGQFTFVLTHLLGEKLDKDAYFYVGNMEKWELDFQNGKKLIYTIVYMNPDNPMCGITARDNFGDTCEICITKTSGDGTSVEFKYGSRTATYKGHLLR